MKLINVIGASLVLTAFVGRAMEPNNAVNEQLFDAVKNGNYALVEHLLNPEELSSGDLQLDMCNEKNHTLLYVAAKNGHADLVKLLLSKGANSNGGELDDDIDQKDDEHVYKYKTPLHAAARKGHLAIVRLLLDAGAHANAFITIDSVDPTKDAAAWSVLHEAAQNGHLDIVKLLLVKGADVEILYDYSSADTPLHLAAQNGYAEVVQCLLNMGFNATARNGMKKTPLHLAFENNHATVVDLLINHGARDVNNPGIHHWAHLHGAAINGNERLITFLLAQGADVNVKEIYTKNETALYRAVEAGNIGVAQLLLAKGALLDAKTTSHSTLLHAAMEDEYRFVEKIIKTPAAAEKERLEVIKLLLVLGFDANAQTNKRETPLYLLVNSYTSHSQVYYAQVIELLLSKGADITARYGNNKTLLHLAAEKGKSALIKLLIDKGLDVNAQDSEGDTPLSLAVDSYSRLAVEILLSYGASIPPHLGHGRPHHTLKDAQDNRLKLSQATEFKMIAQLLSKGAYSFPVIQMHVDNKRKELFEAIQNNNIQTVTKLLKEGFTLNTCDKEGNTLLHKAIQSNSLQVVDLLLSLGAHKYIGEANKHGFTPLQLLISKGLLVRTLSPRGSNDQDEHKVGVKRKH